MPEAQTDKGGNKKENCRRDEWLPGVKEGVGSQ